MSHDPHDHDSPEYLKKQSNLIWIIGVSLLVLMFWWPLRQRPGLGTLAMTFLPGACCDLVLSIVPVPADLDRLVLACLAKQPDDRPASAAALSRSLAAIEVEPWGEDKAMHWWQVNRPA